MIQLQSITTFFHTHGQLRKSQRTTLAALVWAVIRSTLLGSAIIGRHLAMADEITTTAKHTIKRVDRFLGNPRIDLGTAQGDLIAYVLGPVPEALLTLDWTDPKDGVHQILSLNWRAHGRAIPLGWITVRKDALKDRMRAIEVAWCQRVAAYIPPTCHPILLADRGFAAVDLFHALDALGWDWVIRTKGAVWIQSGGRWRPLYGYARERPVLQDVSPVRYGRRYRNNAYACRVIVYAESGYRDPWYLVVSAGLRDWEAGRLIAAYGQRFTTEECFKDQKNDHYEGFHLDAVTLSTPERWDRLLLVFAWAYYWLNVAGWAMETAGKAREWRANTVKDSRTHALWRLGHWGLAHHDVVWRTLVRTVRDFCRRIPPVPLRSLKTVP